MTYHATVQTPGHADQTWNAKVKDGRDRMEMPDGKVLIRNAIEGKALFLDPEHKTATISTLEKVRPDHPGFPFYNIEKLADPGTHPVVSLGKKQIAGRDADGIRFTVGLETRTVWRDPATSRPVQFETELPATQFNTQPLHFTYSNIVFDAPLDDSLFAIQPPPGYERKEGARMRFESVQIPATQPATQPAGEVLIFRQERDRLLAQADALFPSGFSWHHNGQTWPARDRRPATLPATTQETNRQRTAARLTWQSTEKDHQASRFHARINHDGMARLYYSLTPSWKAPSAVPFVCG